MLTDTSRRVSLTVMFTVVAAPLAPTGCAAPAAAGDGEGEGAAVSEGEGEGVVPAEGEGEGGVAEGEGEGEGSDAERCARIRSSVHEAGFDDAVDVVCDGTVARIVSDAYPSHTKMTGIRGTNDQVPVPAPGYTSVIPLRPTLAASPTTIDAAVAVAVNGVPIYDYTSQGLNDPSRYDPAADTLLTGELDQCNGHSGRGDDYHYHAAPTCMMAMMANRGPSAIIGWGLDGYPIYGNDNPDGTPLQPGDLDACNARDDDEFGKRYHTSDAPPYITQCLVGVVDLATAPRVPPLDNAAGGGKPPGTKPPGGVTNLTFVEGADGRRTMTYTHQGVNYSIEYTPSLQADCWDFVERSFTTGGVARNATYCRHTP